tara:strand:- start:393 stop:1775 length:1383 start_codon:yes stop_codon:yes gene_type:complete
MEYVSTRNTQKSFSFKDVFLKGLAPDGGLFVPKAIPIYSLHELEKLKSFSYKDLAAKIILEFCGNEFNKEEIKELVINSYKSFRVKDVVKIQKLEKLNLLELFHGPTLAFKDIAMQIIGNMYEKILEKNKLKVNVVVATSGDTGAAAIGAIKDRKNIKIFVLHPEGRISEVQRKFMTTINVSNVFNLAIKGNFDDCQRLVKSMFLDEDFRSSINLSGVNSINWARIIFQIVYYFYCYFKICNKGEKINFSVPTGNFGDIYAGYVAKKMGLPINKLIIATNKNDILKRVVNTGLYKPLKVEHTISPSMDIQVASNFERLIFDVTSCSSERTNKLMKDLKENGEFSITEEELKKIKNTFSSESLNEEETKSIINNIYKSHKILIDPHTAVGVGAVKKISLNDKTVVLATAHAAKFSDAVMLATNAKPELPENLKNILTDKEYYDNLPMDLKKIKKYILEKIQ